MSCQHLSRLYVKFDVSAQEDRRRVQLANAAVARGAVRLGVSLAVDRRVKSAGELSEAADEGAVGDMRDDVRDRRLRAVVEHEETGRLEQRGCVCSRER